MITSEVARILTRKVPNYHICSAKFVRGSNTVCACPSCKHSIKRRANEHSFVTFLCGRVAEDLRQLKCEGNAIVSTCGTCDAAEFMQEKYDDFKLERERVKVDDFMQTDPMHYANQYLPNEEQYVQEP